MKITLKYFLIPDNINIDDEHPNDTDTDIYSVMTSKPVTGVVQW